MEVGSGTGEILNAVKPEYGVGLDMSPVAVKLAREKYSHLHFYESDIDKEIGTKDKFDYIIVSDLIGYLEDIQTSFENLSKACHCRSRLLITQYNNLWWPFLKFGEFIRMKQRQPIVNWIGEQDLINMLELAGFEVVKKERRFIFPFYIPFISWFLNKIIVNLPLINYFCLVQCFILRRRADNNNQNEYNVSVIIPARNEKGNIEDAVKYMPVLGKSTEIIFVEGWSLDGTLEEIKRVISVYGKQKNISFYVQKGRGKYDAVKLGFEHSTGEILMILDADLTVSPESLEKFYEVIKTHHADFVQGTRLIYPIENSAMPFLNYLANNFFGLAFSWLLGQHISDTLCGTKVIFKEDYEKIAANRHFFGNFDPFGDFDLIFGASKLNLKLVELPIHYRERKYGSTNISRFRHGLLLLKMLLIGIRKFKFN